MRRRAFLFWIFLLVSTILGFGQNTSIIKVDSVECQDEFNKLRLSDNKVVTALIGAGKYIQSIVGTTIARKCIKLDHCGSRESSRMVYAKDIHQMRSIGEDTCYELLYNVIDDSVLIGSFELFVDRNGTPLYLDDYSDFSSPELIRGFRKYFEKQFRVNYYQALEIAKKKGFWVKPFLQCKTERKFISNGQGEIFVKVKYYWTFSQVWNQGDHATLSIDVETGKIERETYVPRMPG